eukprot:TRINITY_DN574_c0_g1_i8.p1 TRINITY_DN574_c0_g1~~TRINITY_DN574_c0_g1_i8.p1  ORF type:complete len:252 (-),score=26.19 TRINITY_DN574_c0_g1_i8:915-1670(-)
MVGWMAATNLDVTWDCFPTGHGKGPWDSEGYQLKRYAFDVARSAQRYKLKGEISDARSLFEVASQKMKVADPSNSISQRVFNFLPDITDNSPSYGEKPIHGIRNNFFSFRSLVKGYQNIVQEYTMGYRAISCFCALCINGDYEACETPGSGIYNIAECLSGGSPDPSSKTATNPASKSTSKTATKPASKPSGKTATKPRPDSPSSSSFSHSASSESDSSSDDSSSSSTSFDDDEDDISSVTSDSSEIWGSP